MEIQENKAKSKENLNFFALKKNHNFFSGYFMELFFFH